MDPSDDDSFVDKSEFRVLLVALAKYCELWVAFEEIDDGDDHRINFEEFEGALPQIEKWGVKVEDAKATFDEMDGNDGGQVLFNEFCRWAMKAHINVDGDVEEEFAQYEEEVIPKPKKKKRDTTPEEVKLLRSLDDKLPTGKTDDEKAQRAKMFESADQSGSGQLSLAE